VNLQDFEGALKTHQTVPILASSENDAPLCGMHSFFTATRQWVDFPTTVKAGRCVAALSPQYGWAVWRAGSGVRSASSDDGLAKDPRQELVEKGLEGIPTDGANKDLGLNRRQLNSGGRGSW